MIPRFENLPFTFWKDWSIKLLLKNECHSNVSHKKLHVERSVFRITQRIFKLVIYGNNCQFSHIYKHFKKDINKNGQVCCSRKIITFSMKYMHRDWKNFYLHCHWFLFIGYFVYFTVVMAINMNFSPTQKYTMSNFNLL